MTTKELVCKIRRKKGYMYCVDGSGCVWEFEANRGMTKKSLDTKRRNKKRREMEENF